MIFYKPGRSCSFSLWHDPWCNRAPLAAQFDYSLLSALEATASDEVNYIQENGQWNLGVSTHYLVRDLRNLCSAITPTGTDTILWNDCFHSRVSISVIYNDIATHKSPPPWLEFVWNIFSVPRYAISAWLILQQRLLTKDRILRFGMIVDPTCVLCASDCESHSHIFSNCPYTHTVLSACPVPVCTSWNDFTTGSYIRIGCPRITRFIAAAWNAIWTERNNRIYRNVRRNPAELISLVRAQVREKLYSCPHFRKRVQADQTIMLLLY
ncbi:uncharacterized protein LOC108223310 [Daucus carota subsp. sativus]|uniref:uncharacterized protein LOC108223310 n=1 Tax=Daucus carota subsp. sativus TaxID=79200 RepID=UPI0007EFBA8F|nr:PREDICTED: uncharacterized protein LOC108223310 [Daucus carota subsp. sativus]